eukprot:jgi/Mesen1/7346/ME000377S06571
MPAAAAALFFYLSLVIPILVEPVPPMPLPFLVVEHSIKLSLFQTAAATNAISFLLTRVWVWVQTRAAGLAAAGESGSERRLAEGGAGCVREGARGCGASAGRAEWRLHLGGAGEQEWTRVSATPETAPYFALFP